MVGTMHIVWRKNVDVAKFCVDTHAHTHIIHIYVLEIYIYIYIYPRCCRPEAGNIVGAYRDRD